MRGVSRIIRVAFTEGKYFLEVEGGREELPTENFPDKVRLEELVGRQVEVLYSQYRRAVVALVAEGLRPVSCYIPWSPWPPPFMC